LIAEEESFKPRGPMAESQRSLYTEEVRDLIDGIEAMA
jgi:hypothetical protein